MVSSSIVILLTVLWCARSYGLEGYQIIMLAITFMFTDDSFDLTPFHPLDHTAFCTKVLLPEVSTQLIQQDLPHLDWKSAIRAMQNSQQFGAEMHPSKDSIHVDGIMEQTVVKNCNANQQLAIKMEAQEATIADSELEYKEVIENGKVVLLLDDWSDIICTKYINLYIMERELISGSHYEFELILSFWISYMSEASKFL